MIALEIYVSIEEYGKQVGVYLPREGRNINQGMRLVDRGSIVDRVCDSASQSITMHEWHRKATHQTRQVCLLHQCYQPRLFCRSSHKCYIPREF